mmetsp:Transcript_83931/g.237404  ORF Transcript_83931/g.237404 Transcript_83931/m.237404 type:complete len:1469 (+) Transcript_83931:229-4635(+)
MVQCAITRECDVSCMVWQAKNKILATGWEDGHIAIYSLNNQKLDCVYSNDKDHSGARLSFLMWNPMSSRLVSGDSAGVVRVWKSDSRGALSMYKQYKCNSATTAGVFSTAGHMQSRSDVLGHAFSPSFFYGTEDGKVYFADDLGHMTEVQALSSSVDCMKFYGDKSRLVIITRALLMVQLQVGDDGRVAPVMKVKLSIAGSGEKSIKQVVWAGPGLIAAASGENLVRLWNLASDENYTLSLSSAGRMVGRSDRIVSVAFNPVQRYLAAGTMEGKVALWRFVGELPSPVTTAAAEGGEGGEPVAQGSVKPEDWEPMAPAVTAKGAVTKVSWGPGRGLLCAGGSQGSSVLREDVLHRKISGSMVAIQLNSNLVRLERLDGDHFIQKCDINIRGIAVTETHLAVWNGSHCQVFEVQDSMCVAVSSHQTSAGCMAFSKDDSILRTVGSAVEICNYNGVVKKRISFSEGEGEPTHLDINGKFLAVATSNGQIKLFDLSKREAKTAGTNKNATGAPKQLGSSGKFVDSATGESLGSIRSIACNADGTRVSILSDHVHGALRMLEPDTRLHVYDADRDVVDNFNCTSRGRYPVSHFWDTEEPKLLACETTRIRAASSEAGGPGVAAPPAAAKEAADEGKEGEEGKDDEGKDGEDKSASEAQKQFIRTKQGDAAPTESEMEVLTLFVTTDFGVLMQDAFPLEAPFQALIGVQVPRLYFAGTKENEESGAGAGGAFGNGPFVMNRVLQDFIGLEDVDVDTRAALLDFSYYLTIGNMDEAHRAVKLIRNPSVWENMAHMCVKTKRLDVAEVCLGNMGHARGAAAVRLAKQEAEPEACIAAVAIQLGLIHDADRLYRECGRYDLLNQLYQASGFWDRALDVAETKDRIHLKTTHHHYAMHLEAIGDINGAVKHFELADTHRTEVPRMLFDLSQVSRDPKVLSKLEEYIAHSSDPELIKWWAGYCESIGQYDKARHFYHRAQNYFSLVRIACFNREIPRAKNIVEETNNAAAAYYLARYLEGMTEVQEAINYYAQSGCYNHAIRLAKNFGLDSELMSYAIKSRPSLMVECAVYFESKGEFEKAVQLYQKGGDIPKALDLCFKAGSQGRTSMFEVLKNIANDLDDQTSPQTVARCAEFFIEHGQFEKAVQLFMTGKRYVRAIDLCMQHKVKLTDEMVEGLTPPKETPPEGTSAADAAAMEEERLETLRALAKACKKQGAFQLACKKFTQAGDRVKAMKCLLKSGDTKNITYYANVSRNREIYVLAANYLQSLDWQNDPKTMKDIVLFYTKAKAWEQLSTFFDSYAQMEIDEYRDYEKALEALKKAATYMVKARTPDKEHLLANLQQRIYHIEQFVTARLNAKDDPAAMVRICHALLEQQDVESALRVGDCFALLIEFYHGQKNYDAAYKLIENMRSRQIVLHPYLEQDMIEEVHRMVGVPLVSEAAGDDGEVDDDVAEELDEEVDEVVSDEDEGDFKFGGK